MSSLKSTDSYSGHDEDQFSEHCNLSLPPEDDSTTTTTTNHNNDTKQSKKKKPLDKVRCGFLTILVVTGILVSVGIFYFVRYRESNVSSEVDYPIDTPTAVALMMAAVFVIILLLFAIYDTVHQRRNSVLAQQAERSLAIVSSLFPSNVRDRLFGNQQEEQDLQQQQQQGATKRRGSINGNRNQLKRFLDHDDDNDTNKEGTLNAMSVNKPIADLFTDCTILFADLVGFTAWSSVREPCQVFTLLETLFAAFDEIAERRKVFKVETVGDCYVAVTGLPDPRKDHAVVMAVRVCVMIMMIMRQLLCLQTQSLECMYLTQCFFS